MGLFDIPESLLRNDAPIVLFHVNDSAVKVRLLGSAQAEVWAAQAREINQLEDQLEWLSNRLKDSITRRDRTQTDEDHVAAQADVNKWYGKIESVQKDKFIRIRASLRDYSPEVFTPEVLDAATPIQLIGAWLKLKQYSDPFLVTNTLQLEAWERMREKLPSIAAKASPQSS